MARKSRAPRKSSKGKRKTPDKRSSTAQQVTSEQALRFIRRLQRMFPKPPDRKEDKARLQKYLKRFTDAQLKAVGRRIQGDLMLRPPRTIHPGDFEKARRRYPRGKSK